MNVLLHFSKWSLGLADAETQTTEAERSCLAQNATGRRSLVEIGVWHAVTTKRLRAVMAEEGILYAVDPYPRGRLLVSFQQIIAHKEVGKVARGKIAWIREQGEAACAQAQKAGLKEVDFIFIDGDHSYDGIRKDWEVWSPLVVPGGIVALHDSRSTEARNIDTAGSVIYTREHILCDCRFTLIAEVDSLVVLRRAD